MQLISPSFRNNLVKHLKEQGYDLFESNDNFYNDLCSPYNSFNDTDVILKDRKYDFYDTNITLCEDICKYEGFDLESLRANCKCEIKTEIKSVNQVKFSPNNIIENFYKIDKYTNIKIFICYKLVFSLIGQNKNYGSYIMITITVLFIILLLNNFFTLYNKITNFLQKMVSDYLSINFLSYNRNQSILFIFHYSIK